jgi:hypothetical protein
MVTQSKHIPSIPSTRERGERSSAMVSIFTHKESMKADQTRISIHPYTKLYSGWCWSPLYRSSTDYRITSRWPGLGRCTTVGQIAVNKCPISLPTHRPESHSRTGPITSLRYSFWPGRPFPFDINRLEKTRTRKSHDQLPHSKVALSVPGLSPLDWSDYIPPTISRIRGKEWIQIEKRLCAV